MTERETQDPIAALESKDIHERAAAARDLSNFGTPEVIPTLVQMARKDISPAVRLCVAGSAADILSRYRAGHSAGQLSVEARTGFYDLFKGIDPAVNAGLFSMLACVGLPQAFDRIAAGLRDPRGGVRVGAAVGLRRLCGSLAHQGDDELEARVVALLGDSRLPPDALAEVAQVAAAVGYRSAREAMERLDLPGAQGDLVSASLQVLDGHEAPITGAWLSDGRDLGEVNPEPSRPPALLVVDEAGAAVRQDGGAAWQLLTPLRGVRPMFARRVGEPQAARCFQWSGRVWYKAQDDDVMEAVERLHTVPWDWTAGSAGEAAVRAAELVMPGLPDSPAAMRTKAALQLGAGRAAEAEASLVAATEGKKCPPEVWLLLGDAKAARGDADGAAEAWESALKKAKSRKHPLALLALERLGQE